METVKVIWSFDSPRSGRIEVLNLRTRKGVRPFAGVFEKGIFFANYAINEVEIVDDETPRRKVDPNPSIYDEIISEEAQEFPEL